MFNEHPNCFMDKSLDSLNVQWTSELFHGQIPWFPECSMNIQIVMYKSLKPLDVQWTCSLLWKNHLIPSMPNEHPNLMDKPLDSLNVQWTSKLFHGKITYFPKCSMKIQIVSWTNHLIPSLFNEHTNCLMGKPLDSQHVQWTSKLFHGQTSWFPTCSMNMQIISWKNNLIS